MKKGEEKNKYFRFNTIWNGKTARSFAHNLRSKKHQQTECVCAKYS